MLRVIRLTRFNEFDVTSVEFIRCGERTLSPLAAQLAQEAAEKIVEWVLDADDTDRTD
jgi:hypothetical protein